MDSLSQFGFVQSSMTAIMNCLFVCMCSDPDWVDLSFGVFICIDCSGIHRSLGSHLTKVKSISLDNFTDDNVAVRCFFFIVIIIFFLSFQCFILRSFYKYGIYSDSMEISPLTCLTVILQSEIED